jgi:hypothetical protein
MERVQCSCIVAIGAIASHDMSTVSGGDLRAIDLPTGSSA